MKSIIGTVAFILAIVFSSNAQTDAFFNQTDVFLKKHVRQGKINYQAAKTDANLNKLITQIANQDLSKLSGKTKQAFLINAYNLLVIKGASEVYPTNSVQTVSGFFDTKKHTVGGKKITLNGLEKDLLLKEFGDARFHFVLVCGALGCPPITDFAYTPAKLEQQKETQTQLGLNDPNFVKVNNAETQVQLSQIFKWYSSDFGGNKATAIDFINKYRNTKISTDYKVSFYEYDWTLNEQTGSISTLEIEDNDGNSANRYVVSSAIPKGTVEAKIFNNLYTQKRRTGGKDSGFDARETFFTSTTSILYGVTNRFNAGFDLRYRRVNSGDDSLSPFSVLGSQDDANNRSGFTNAGPKIRWAPTAKLPNFSIQSQFWIPIGSDLGQTATQPYIDWDGSTWLTQFFNDFTLNDKFSLFTEVDITFEDIGGIDRFSTSAVGILSYFPTPKTTIYVLGNYTPRWQDGNTDYFAQAGVGAKYQITSDVEVELLYTAFTDKSLQENNGSAATYNLGFRFSLF
jgi:hypothetical protein